MIKRNHLIIFIIAVFSIITFPECSSYYKIPVVKNKKRWRPYDASKDRKKNRTKIVKYKSRK